MIVLGILLGVSVILNGLCGWYIYNAIKKIQFMSQSIEDLDYELISFKNHLKHVYELEMYYGDETLERLIVHMKELDNTFADFRKDYQIFNGDLDETKFFEEEEDNAAKENDSREDLFLKRT